MGSTTQERRGAQTHHFLRISRQKANDGIDLIMVCTTANVSTKVNECDIF